MPATKRPSQYKQSSRKGKKAWRKNIDLEDIEKAIESNVEKEITHGTDNLEALPADALFQVDVKGDNILKSKLIKRKQIKKNIKSKEILESIASASKVPAVVHAKAADKKKIQGVSKRELNNLLALAGRKLGESKLKAQVAKDGLVKSGSFDLWGESTVVTTPAGMKLDTAKDVFPEELLNKSTTGWSVATTVPGTMKLPPIKVQETEEIPHAGKSYNPDKVEWKDLIDKEYAVEKVWHERRVRMEEYQEKIRHLMATLDDNEEESDNDEETSEPAEEEEEEEADDVDIKLSVNPAVKYKKKTKYQRNKQRRHEEKVKLQKELKALKGQLHELEKLEEIEQEVAEKAEKQVPTSNKVSKPPRAQKTHKLGTKHAVIEGNLEIKFSDECSDSLRKLKPEGSLLYDNVKKLQSSGKIETRIPFMKSKKPKQKITEKWTYKDFK